MTCRLCSRDTSLDHAVILDTPAGTQLFSDDAKTALGLRTSISIVECPSCSLIQLVGDPVVYDHVSSSSSFVSEQLTEHRIKQLRELFKMRQASEGSGSMLEIGCGDGHLLETAKGLFGHVVGIEPTQRNANTAASRGVDVYQMLMAEDTVVPGGPFNYFCSFHVLEHVTQISSVLQGIFRGLTSDAVGVIEVPATEAAIENKRYGDFMPDHLNYYTMSSLRTALETNGFVVEKIYRDWGGEHLVAYVRKRATKSSVAFISERQKNIQILVDIVNTRGLPFVVWGASHHVLPYMPILEKIHTLLVIDGSSSKVDKFIPSTGVCVSPLSALHGLTHSYVAVAAPRFQNEIVPSLSQMFTSVSEVQELSDRLGFKVFECRAAS